MNGIIKGNTGDWEMVIGLEVHAQIASESKLFSGAPNDFGAEPNQNVSFVDAGFPGMLPVINAKCVEQAVRTGLGLQAQINQHSVFDRKNYFYPDLPSGYQISQFLDPVVGKGVLHVELEDGSIKDVGITRLHLEQDAGKSLHEHSPTMSFIDLNRAGIALMEIVSEPDLRTPEEAGAYLKKLRAILRYLGTCGGDMDKGEMRCDANVSVRPVGSTTLGTRCEIKNVNSVRFLMRAIQFEAERQVQILESGGKIDQETRLYDSVAHETRTMRTKEDAHDYRYFPDPDLLPLVLSDAFVANIKASLPELPDEKKARYMRDFGLTPYDASVIVSDKAAAEYYETVLAALTSPSRGEVGLQGRVGVDAAGVSTKDTPTSIGMGTPTSIGMGTPTSIHRGTPTSIHRGTPTLALPPLGGGSDTARLAATWMTAELYGRLNKMGVEIADSPVSAVALAGLLTLIADNTISGKIAKDVLDKMIASGKDAATIVQEEGLQQVTDSGAIEKVIAEVIAANPDKLAEYRSGKDKLFGFFVGQVMKASGGKANPAAVNDLLKAKLSDQW